MKVVELRHAYSPTCVFIYDLKIALIRVWYPFPWEFKNDKISLSIYMEILVF